GKRETPLFARFHAGEDGALHVVDLVHRTESDGSSILENRLFQVLPRENAATPRRLVLNEPFTTFFTAAERGGSRPSTYMDLFGSGREPTSLRYARIRLR